MNNSQLRLQRSYIRHDGVCCGDGIGRKCASLRGCVDRKPNDALMHFSSPERYRHVCSLNQLELVRRSSRISYTQIRLAFAIRCLEQSLLWLLCL